MRAEDFFHHSWQPLFKLLHQEPLLTLNTQVLPQTLCYPPKENIFRVFRMPLDSIKVVIVGQDPYHGPGQANGLAFAVNMPITAPPSLRIIFDEIRRESNNDPFTHRDLEHWEEQGVFLLNTALTVESGKPGSHLNYWDHFIRNVINYISVTHPTVWMLWGQKAQGFIANMPPKTLFKVDGYTVDTIHQIPNNPYQNYILRSAHPASEVYRANAGFLGNNHFMFANTILSKLGKEEINW